MKNTNNEKAIKGESYIYNKLKENDIEARWTSMESRKHPYDFVTKDGKTIDVKYAESHRSAKRNNGSILKSWRFNCHHHGIKQTNIDYYICILNDMGKTTRIYIFPSEFVGVHTIAISERQINRGKYDYFEENWGLIKEKT